MQIRASLISLHSFPPSSALFLHTLSKWLQLIGLRAHPPCQAPQPMEVYKQCTLERNQGNLIVSLESCQTSAAGRSESFMKAAAVFFRFDVFSDGACVFCVIDREMQSQQPLHVATPLRHSLPLSKEAGTSVYLKLDSSQPTGSFKIRGIGHLCRTVRH